jgi:hypothetical protein
MMPSPVRISDIAVEIARTKSPALLIDTCIALDILRCAARGNSRIVPIAKQFIDAKQQGELLLYSHSSFQLEIERNRITEESAVAKDAKMLDSSLHQYRQVALSLDVPYPHVADYSHQSLITPLNVLLNQFLASCVHIAEEDTIKLAAFKRSSHNRRPARKGGGTNDCAMFEEFLAIAKAVPTAEPLVLFTTNVDDFAERSKGSFVHQELLDDLAGTQAQICLNWEWAAKAVLSAARVEALSK